MKGRSRTLNGTTEMPMADTDAIELPLDGILDLHTFNPGDLKDLVPEYVAACRARGILQIRIIHGKGTGVLREIVHSILRRLHEVVSFRLTTGDAGGWGATAADLKPPDDVSTG